MSDLTLSKQFSLLVLNGLDSIHMTTAKKAALRSILASYTLEEFIKQPFSMDRAPLLLDELKKVSSASGKTLKDTERELKKGLMDLRLIKESPNLLACDMNYVTANVTIKEYYSAPYVYAQIKEHVSDELKMSGNVTDTSICLFWLLRESGCFYDIFSEEEEDHLSARIRELYEQSPFAKTLFSVVIQKPLEQTYQHFLRKKTECFSTPLGAGILFTCPIFERSQSVFIEMEEWFSNKDKRLSCIVNRISSVGLDFEVLRAGEVPKIRINNQYYECIPTQVVSKLPIQGVRLRRFFPEKTIQS